MPAAHGGSDEMEVGVVEPGERGMHLIEHGDAFWYLAERGVGIQQVAEPGEEQLIFSGQFLLCGGDAVFFGFVEFCDNHAGEKSMKPLFAGELVGVAPDADEVAAVAAKGVGVVMTDDEPVKVFHSIVRAGVEPVGTPVSQEHDSLCAGAEIQRVSDFHTAGILGYSARFYSLVEGAEHGGGPVFGVDDDHGGVVHSGRNRVIFQAFLVHVCWFVENGML